MDIETGVEIRDLEEHLSEATAAIERLCMRREELTGELDTVESARDEILEQMEEGEVLDEARVAEVRRELEATLEALRDEMNRTVQELDERQAVVEQVRDKCAEQIKRSTEAADTAGATPGGAEAVHVIWNSINDLQDLLKRASDALARLSR